MSNTFIRLRNINKNFQSNSAIIPAVMDCSINICKGDFVSITGPSGSGKSTLLNIIGLLSPFDSGAYDLNGVDVSAYGDSLRANIRNKYFGFIFQGFELIDDLSVFENVLLPLNYRKIKNETKLKMVEDTIKTVGLWSRKSHWPNQLSGGQQQRVAIARALIGNPSIILADEPTGNLDKEMAEAIFKLLIDINSRGTTIVMVTHDLSIASRAQQQIKMKNGKILK